MNRIVLPVMAGLMVALLLFDKSSAVESPDERSVQLKKVDSGIRVEIDGELFTEFLDHGYNSPILYPVIGPGGKGVTRNYPMKKGVKGEAEDHPHHRSIWYGHEGVNGGNYWAPVGNNPVRILPLNKPEMSYDEDGAVITSEHKWVAKEDGPAVLTDKLVFHFSVDEHGGRIIDVDLTMTAPNGDVKMDDNKDGIVGIRMHPALRLKPNPKDKEAPVGNGINSEGVKGKAMWGKSARWVDYWGEIDGKVTGVAMFDHPANLRHPTTWHAQRSGFSYTEYMSVAFKKHTGFPPQRIPKESRHHDDTGKA